MAKRSGWFGWKAIVAGAAGLAMWVLPAGAQAQAAVPAAPSGLKATSVSSKSVRLVWTDRSNNETSFRIYYRAPQLFGGSWATRDVPANQAYATVSGLCPEATWEFAVKAVNASGASAASNHLYVVTKPCAPLAVTRLRLTALTARSATVAWTPDKTSPAQATGFIVRYRELGGAWIEVTVSKTTTSYTLGNLRPATSYECSVVALNSVGRSSSNPSIGFRTPSAYGLAGFQEE